MKKEELVRRCQARLARTKRYRMEVAVELARCETGQVDSLLVQLAELATVERSQDMHMSLVKNLDEEKHAWFFEANGEISLTPKYLELLEYQAYTCAICQTSTPLSPLYQGDDFHIQALLCSPCENGLRAFSRRDVDMGRLALHLARFHYQTDAPRLPSDITLAIAKGRTENSLGENESSAPSETDEVPNGAATH